MASTYIRFSKRDICAIVGRISFYLYDGQFIIFVEQNFILIDARARARTICNGVPATVFIVETCVYTAHIYRHLYAEDCAGFTTVYG